MLKGVSVPEVYLEDKGDTREEDCRDASEDSQTYLAPLEYTNHNGNRTI